MEVKPVKNICKVLQSFQNPSGLKKDNHSQRDCLNQLSHQSLSHIKQEHQESLTQGKIHIQQNLNEDHKYL